MHTTSTDLRRFANVFLTIAFPLQLISCGSASSESTFFVKHAPVFSRARTVSVFGAIHHGGASKSAWGSVAPAFADAMGATYCEAGFVEQLRDTNADAFLAIEQEIELGQVKEELLQSVAPAASGESILTIQIFGRVRNANVDTRRILVAHGGGSEPRSDTATALASPPPTLDISATLFSKHQRRTVGLLSMTYSGASLDEALHEFVKKLHSMMPNFVCRGWNWSAVQIARETDDAGLPLRRARILPAKPR